MLSIVQRYLILEIFKSSAATILILFVILMSNTLGRVLSEVSDGEVPIEALLPVFLGQSIQILSFLLPLGFFLGVVFAFGRLYKDHELVVLHACGFGYKQLYSSVVLIMLPIVLLTAWLSIWMSAEALQSAKNIVDEKKDIHQFQRLKVGQFNLSKDKKNVFFMQSMSANKLEIQDVIITQKGEQSNVLETAKFGKHKLDGKTGDLFLEVGPGTRYEGKAGSVDYKIIEFDTHGILLEKNQTKIDALKPSEKHFSQLQQSKKRKDKVEVLWRLNIPLTLIILGLLAVPLSYISPRQGRYGRIGLALLVFIVYLNLLGFSKGAMERDSLPMWLNFWWVHIVFIILTLLLLKQRTKQSILFWRGKSQ
ncbi:MAG: LPS export ABC transporter permease LptF [Gammaproteobacteria bacterium]|jgi:lipopolysaccharide export system permease protein|nr:LPS export ABC transporter permease LptF [Gammaproteobacteria bacterium]MBT3725661.1 LPS export ABC transporter permease LptF [Gammaproteobacteria bacterium]MBT4075464.1 LPS export ABC transporter permease LptF [Gammaproteobacteria bacterium]MBT4195688.1 LPS export ABC transporter permease LptF [Gammaproteobacteria bacterium]MBT4449172.1 LPS export ABC transporter permease LptF [Gammaproteobacteria bacterium]